MHTDDKILLSWNSMTIAALSMLYRPSKNEKYLNAALNSQRFIKAAPHKDRPSGFDARLLANFPSFLPKISS